MEFFETKNNELKLSIIGDDEPNYGRMLKIVKVEKNNIDITKQLEPNWNRINFNLSKFQFSIPEIQYCFIPFESGGILYDYQNDKIISLKYNSLLGKHRRFIGNIFTKNNLIVVFDHLIQVVNLKSQLISNFESETNERFVWVTEINDYEIDINIDIIEITGSVLNKIDEVKRIIKIDE